MARAYPSLVNTQYESIRVKIDSRFLDHVRELEDAYYGTALTFDPKNGQALSRAADGWKHGSAHVFTSGLATYNMLGTLELSKVQFDKLHGAIWTLYSNSLIDQNVSDGSPFGDLDSFQIETVLPREAGDPSDLVRIQKSIASRKTENNSVLAGLASEGITVVVL